MIIINHFLCINLSFQVAICLDFCEDIYQECKKAEYQGKTIEDVYKNGIEFCEAQDFKVIPSNQQCFEFDSTVFSKANYHITNAKLFLVCLLLILFNFF